MSRARAASLAVLLGACLACSPAGRRPDIVLITIDTLRADHLEVYGYGRATAPTIARIASKGVVFENAYSTSSWTVPALASLHTGLHPPAHGMVQGAVEEGEKIVHQQFLPQSLPLLSEMLRDRGYRTIGLVANGHLASKFGFGRGFDHYECLGFAATADKVTERARALVASKPELFAGPYFLWVHYFDPHLPYLLREPWFSNFYGPRKPPPLAITAAPEDYEEMNLERSGPEVELLVASYDAEIRYTDEMIAALLQAVPRAEQSLLTITADHGEEFLEHGRFGHGPSLHQELIRIPLVIRFPDRAHVGRSQRVASMVDLAPTLLAAAGAKEWPHHGRSLMPLPGASESRAYPAFASYAREGAEPMDAFILQNWKIIHYPEGQRRTLLYDLQRDPAETRDLSAAEPDRRKYLLRRLMKTVAQVKELGVPRSFRELTSKEEGELRSLGYLQ